MVRNTFYFLENWGWVSSTQMVYDPHGDSQPSISLVPGYPMLAFGPEVCTPNTNITVSKTLIHKIE